MRHFNCLLIFFIITISSYSFHAGYAHAHGSMETNTFSLAGYERADQPMMYFNYFLATEGTRP